jgi:hypothetical protein
MIKWSMVKMVILTMTIWKIQGFYGHGHGWTPLWAEDTRSKYENDTCFRFLKVYAII